MSVDEVFSQIAAVSEAVSKGVKIVVLEGGDQGGGRVYEAACALKPVVVDRAYFLIAERVDVASAIGASGVVLQDDGSFELFNFIAPIFELTIMNRCNLHKSQSVA